MNNLCCASGTFGHDLKVYESLMRAIVNVECKNQPPNIAYIFKPRCFGNIALPLFERAVPECKQVVKAFTVKYFISPLLDCSLPAQYKCWRAVDGALISLAYSLRHDLRVEIGEFYSDKRLSK